MHALAVALVLLAPVSVAGATVPPVPLKLGAAVVVAGVSVTLTERTHKETAGPHRTVVGVWEVEVKKGSAAPITERIVDEHLYLEGAGFGATWVIDGGYDHERVSAWNPEAKPLSEDEALAVAEKAAKARGAAVDASASTVEGGVLRVTYDNGKKPVHVEVGLYTRKLLSITGP